VNKSVAMPAKDLHKVGTWRYFLHPNNGAGGNRAGESGSDVTVPDKNMATRSGKDFTSGRHTGLSFNHEATSSVRSPSGIFRIRWVENRIDSAVRYG
jgi:hypothetical protein